MNSVFRSRVILLLIFSLGCLTNAYCQNPQIDSLNRLLKVKREVPVLCELARENVMLENFESALQLADEALLIASKEGDSLGIVMAHRARGVVFRRREQLDKALEEILPAFEIAKRHHYLMEIKFLSNALALIYTSKAQYDRALDYNFQSLVIREAQDDQSEVIITLNNIGFVYSNLMNYQFSLKYFNRALDLKRKLKDTYEEETILINIGLSEMKLKLYSEGLSHIREAFAFCGDQCSDIVKVEGEFGLGDLFYNTGEMEEASKHFAISYTISKKINNHRYQSENLLYMGKIEIRSGAYSIAEKHWKDAEVIASAYKYNQLRLDIEKELFHLYTINGEKDKLIAYQNKYIVLKDSLMNEQLINNIAIIQSRFDERENIRNIKTLEENIVLKNEAIARQQLLNIVLGSAAVLLVIIGILIYRLYALRNKSNKQLDIKVKQRTQQLEEGQTHLQGVLQEQHLFIENIREEMKALTAILKGLSLIGKQGGAMEMESESVAVAGATHRLDAIITRIDRKRDLI